METIYNIIRLNKGAIMKKGLAVILLLIWCYVVYQNLANIDKLVSFTTIILGVIVALMVVPWDKLVHFKAGAFEVSVEKSFKSAVEGYKDSKANELMDVLTKYKETLPIINGARILWIEDRPTNVLGERRILRALGINIKMGTPDVIDPTPIYKSIETDNDYDLIISDIQWRVNKDEVTYGGLEFIRNIRDSKKYSNMQALPVIFYTAYTKEQLETIKEQTKLKFYDNMYFCHDVENLVDRVSKLLVEYRTKPLKVGRKGAT